jgi:GTP-binding protein HflX
MKKVILVGPDIHHDGLNDYSVEELKNLAEARHLEVVYTITQTLKKINPATYIGRGKVNEVKQFVQNLDAELVIFNHELSGSQIRNLEEILNCRVIDRTLLILDIFAVRAKTKEAMLQVELAQLDYMLPRLKSMRTSLSRQQGGIGSRGPGEKKLELDRRKIEHEQTKLKKELEKVVQARQIQRRKRKKSPIIKCAVVGYTNAGKSTLMNKLLEHSSADEKSVKAKDMLFATLETSTRKIELESNKSFILTDTVGFVSNLPHDLIEAFKSTLEEITEADYLIHVVDCSHPHFNKQIETTQMTLEEIGVHDIPTIYIYNKVDLVETPVNPTHFPHIVTSITNSDNLPAVIEFIEQHIFKDYERVQLIIPYDKGDILSKLNEESNIISQSHNDLGITVEVELSTQQRIDLKTFIQ